MSHLTPIICFLLSFGVVVLVSWLCGITPRTCTVYWQATFVSGILCGLWWWFVAWGIQSRNRSTPEDPE